MSRPRLLETHGCQGGAHAGYVRAGWDVTGVDIDKRHARYYPGRLIIADAASYIREHGREYDAIHTSPPCQWYTRGNAKGRATGNSKWSRSIPPIREALQSTGRPYVIENVTDAGWDMVDFDERAALFSGNANEDEGDDRAPYARPTRRTQ